MKKVVYTLIFLFLSLTAMASNQDDKFRLPQQLLQYLIDGKGEEAHQMLSDKLNQ